MATKIKIAPKPPTELRQSKYSKLRKYDIFDWYRELSEIARLSHQLGLDFHSGLSNVVFTPNGDIGQLFEQAVTYLPHQANPFIIPSSHLPALLVRLDVPDGLILAQVYQALGQYRDREGSPIPKPGRQKQNAIFDQRTFYKWRNDRIVPLAYALIWRAKLPPEQQKQHPNSLLGSWYGLNSPRRTSEAKKTLKLAVSSLPQLFSQMVLLEPDRFQRL